MKRRRWRLMTVVNGGVKLTACSGCGGGGEAAPRWGIVDGVMREQLHEGR
jgi:hypothetical protein